MLRPQALISLQAFLPEDREIVKIVNYCDLDPIDSTNAGWKIWQNRYSPYLKIQNNKKIIIHWKEEDFLAPKKDLYAYSGAQDIARISKVLLFITHNECFHFLFLGKDNKLRYRQYLEGTYLNKPPLQVPLEDVRTLIKNENIIGHKSIQLIKGPARGWMTSWPPERSFYQELKKETKICNSPAESLIQECYAI